MIFMDLNENSLQWGESQVIHMNKFVEMEDGDTGTICFESTPVFNQFKFKDSWGITVSAAGLFESEIDARVEHLQDGNDVLVITGESQPRPINEKHTYLYKKFQKSVFLPCSVIPSSKDTGFSNGILFVSFHVRPLSE